MAFVLNDRVKQTSTSTGTATIQLSTNPEVGFESFVSPNGFDLPLDDNGVLKKASVNTDTESTI